LKLINKKGGYMKIIGINASPRKNANTQTLVESALNGAAEKGAETRLVNLRELNINGCTGCGRCKKDIGKCVQKDDLTTLLQDMTTCNAVVMGTPVYWYQVSAQFKMLVDRFYCFSYFVENPEKRGEYITKSVFPRDNQFLFIISRGDPEPAAPHLSQLYDHLNEWLTIIPLELGVAKYKILHQHGAGLDRQSAQNDAALLEKAKSAGADLIL
jgi:putative NADPH-quinone reductase